MTQHTDEIDAKQKLLTLANLTEEQYTLSQELYALTETQRRLVPEVAARPLSMGKVLEATGGKITQTLDRLCELRHQIKALYSNEQG